MGRQECRKVHVFFKFDNATNKSKCNVCGAMLTGKHITNLRRHLTAKHCNLFEEFCTNDTNTNEQQNAKKVKIAPNEEALISSLINNVATDGRPLWHLDPEGSHETSDLDLPSPSDAATPKRKCDSDDLDLGLDPLCEKSNNAGNENLVKRMQSSMKLLNNKKNTDKPVGKLFVRNFTTMRDLDEPTISSQMNKKSLKRKIEHEWTEDEVTCLIAAVKTEPALWDSTSVDDKLVKFSSWRSVVETLNIDGVDVSEAKSKWSSLLVSFNQNPNRQSAHTSSDVTWRYFQQMSFLEQPLLEEIPALDLPQLPEPEKRRTRGNATLVTSQQLPTSSRISTNGQESETTPTTSAGDVSIATSDADRNAAFCKYLLSELCSLSDWKACALRQNLTETLWAFLNRAS